MTIEVLIPTSVIDVIINTTVIEAEKPDLIEVTMNQSIIEVGNGGPMIDVFNGPAGPRGGTMGVTVSTSPPSGPAVEGDLWFQV